MEMFDRLLARADASQLPLAPSAARRYRYRCRCGRPLFFRNSRCLACGTELGFDPARLDLLPLPQEGLVRCSNYGLAGCNWLLPQHEMAAQRGLCRACRLNRTVPDLGQGDNARLWARIEAAKRRLVAQLIAIGLPVASRVSEAPQGGLMFDFLRTPLGQHAVLTGHYDGLVTLNIEEADDARREQIRTSMGEPYRTLLGHLRHEVGHYYWDRLVAFGPWLDGFRSRFGDERADYEAALARHYRQGPAPDWAARCVSAYASTHPWEDWAETWAHYLHMLDALDTAISCGLSGDPVEIEVERYGVDALDDPGAADQPGGAEFLRLVNGWLELTAVLNEFSRSMGQADFYPFVLSHGAVAKLHFVHRVVRWAAQAGRAGEDQAQAEAATRTAAW